MNGHGTTASKAGARQWIGLAFLLLPTMLLTADLGVLWLATPPLAADLGPSSTQLLWINDIYGFVMACLLVLFGNIGDRFGRRKLLLLGLVAFAIASLVATYAPNPMTLILARAALGVGSAAIIPSTLALISHMFTDARQRAKAIAMWVTALSTGIAVGPVVSGVMLEHFWWGSVFLVGVPVMVLALIVTPIAVPEFHNADTKKLDGISMPLLVLTLLPLVYSIKRIGEYGIDQWMLLSLAVAVLFGVLFIRRQQRLSNPLLELRLFSDRTFTTALVLLFIGLAAMNGVEYVVPQYFQLVNQLPSLQAGLLMMLPAAGLALGSQLTPLLARRIRPAYVIAGGAAVSLIGFALMTQLPSDGSGTAIAATGTTVMMTGLAPITVLCTNIAVSAAPPEKAGQASSIGQTAYELGLAFGVAATGSIMAAVYHNDVKSAAPQGVSEDKVTEIADNVSGGATIADGLPGGVGEVMGDAVRAAFTSGFHVAAIISAGLAALMGVLAVLLLRRVPATGGPAQDKPAQSDGGTGTDPVTEPVPTAASS
ncbi:MFS transporter [Streptomyces monticola]|uniref:MFS transporter n=1 Tax=Streptomyces monticola TaxID=2666263 RepID=A0ABW2JX09_9ACTN